MVIHPFPKIETRRYRPGTRSPGGGSPAILLFLRKGSALTAVGSFSLVALGPGLENCCGVSHVLYQEKSLTSPFLGGTRERLAPHVLSSTSASWHDPAPCLGQGGGLAVLAESPVLCSVTPTPHYLLAKLSQLVFLTKASNRWCHRQRRVYLAC